MHCLILTYNSTGQALCCVSDLLIVSHIFQTVLYFIWGIIYSTKCKCRCCPTVTVPQPLSYFPFRSLAPVTPDAISAFPLWSYCHSAVQTHYTEKLNIWKTSEISENQKKVLLHQLWFYKQPICRTCWSCLDRMININIHLSRMKLHGWTYIVTTGHSHYGLLLLLLCF